MEKTDKNRILAIGDIQAFIQYVRNFNQPITQTAQIMNVLQSTAAAAERVFEFCRGKEMMFILGCMFGACVGLLICSLCVAAKRGK